MRATIRGVRIALLVLGLYWLALVVATHVPAQAIQHVKVNDKVAHNIAYSGLAFLLAWAIPTNPKRLSQNVVIATVVGTVYAGVDELTQIPVGRTADWGDFSADLFGILIGIIVYVVMRGIILKTPFRLEA